MLLDIQRYLEITCTVKIVFDIVMRDFLGGVWFLNLIFFSVNGIDAVA